MFVDQNENRDLISKALGAQIPNPGFVPAARDAKFSIFRLALVLLGGHFATVSFGAHGSETLGGCHVFRALCPPELP
jgi:hypothetical protein